MDFHDKEMPKVGFLHYICLSVILINYVLKSGLSGLGQFLAAESLLKLMKNVTFLKIFKFLSCLFGHVEKQLYQKYKVNFKIYDVTIWEKHNCNTRIAQYLKE